MKEKTMGQFNRVLAFLTTIFLIQFCSNFDFKRGDELLLQS